MGKTDIEWTDLVWNTVAGCKHASAGCLNCYAERMTNRLSGMESGRGWTGDQRHYSAGIVHGHGDNKGKWTGKIHINQSRLYYPIGVKKPSRIFVNSMSDTFHEDVPVDFLIKLFGVMHQAERHTFLLLTKRPENMLKFCKEVGLMPAADGPEDLASTPSGMVWPENVWAGITAENQDMLDERWKPFSEVPAAKKFISLEPLLGPVDFSKVPHPKDMYCSACRTFFDSPEKSASPCCEAIMPDGSYNAETNMDTCPECKEEFNDDDVLPVCPNCDETDSDCDSPGPAFSDCFTDYVWERDLPALRELDLVILGGESGPGARPIHPDWIRSVRDQCVGAGVPFMLKQLGAWEVMSHENGYLGGGVPIDKNHTWIDIAGKTGETSNDVGPNAYAMARVGKKAAGRLLDGREHMELPE